MIRRLTSILAGIVLSIGLAGSVSGTATGGSESLCNLGENGSAGMWGQLNYHDDGGTSFAPDGIFSCHGTNVPDMFNIHEDGTENCRGFLGYDSGRFADCVTSIAVRGAGGLDFCVYTDPNYTGYGIVFTGPGYQYISQLSNTYNDRLSSYRWVADGYC